ncbi:MAG: hypothetical protein IKP38_01115 [Clostridia bacterium]|nr:hypothetical protein [Clostridia bacterium]
MKRTAIVLLVLVLPLLLFAESDETQDAVDALVGTIDLSEWDAWFRDNDAGDVLPSEILKQLVGTQTSDTFDTAGILRKLTPSLKPMLAKTALLIGLAAFGAAIDGVTDPRAIGDTAGAAFRVCVSVAVLALSLTEIRDTLAAVRTVERTGEILLPAIVGYLTFSGFTNSASLVPASYALLSDVVLRVLEGCVAPAAIIGGVLIVLDANGTGRLTSVGRLLQRAAKWALGMTCSVYLLITAVRSAVAKNADGLLLKTTRLAAGSIPAIGSLLSESVDSAYQCLRFVKNALGLTGCMALLSVIWEPVISVFLTRSSLRAAALLSEPLAGKPYAELLRGMGDTLHVLMLSELAVTAMALMMLAPMLGTGG